MFFESTLMNFLAFMTYVAVFTFIGNHFFNKVTKGKYRKKKTAVEKYCKNCGHEGAPKSKPGGSAFWTFFWVVVFAPIGILYWISRYGNPIYSCAKCKSQNLIDADSPILKKQKALEA